jgi:fumarylacetoacetate (FAA) hydrolase family protein
MRYAAREVLPEAGGVGTWVGRAWLPASAASDGIAGPRPIVVRGGRAIDVSSRWPTVAHALADDQAPTALARADGPALALDELVDAAHFWQQTDPIDRPCLLAPCDLQAVKACGVTFIESLLERVVEERARGNPDEAQRVRRIITDALGDDLSRVEPGSPPTVALKQRLIEEGLWSAYLEVGIGPDAEVFTKCQPMASVGFGAQIGVLPTSHWNNPEPEVVLAVAPSGRILGAALGNDVNLRDYEGRSALLLGEAKDQNASCAIGPMIRLFDDAFTLDRLIQADVALRIVGRDGFESAGANHLARISRRPEDLVAQARGDHHQYPDGFMLFLGTMFAPTDDRDEPGGGFTHHVGDRVEIASPDLGRLVNWVEHTDAIRPWSFGSMALIDYILRRDSGRATGK